MQFTLDVLKMVENSLVKLLKEDLPIRISYKLSKLYEMVAAEMSKVEELRQQLVKRYGEENEEGITRVTAENIINFNKDFGELMREPVNVDNFEPINIKQILDYSERMENMGKSPISLSAIDLHQLKAAGILSGDSPEVK